MLHEDGATTGATTAAKETTPLWVEPEDGTTEEAEGAQVASLSLLDSQDDLPPVVTHLEGHAGATQKWSAIVKGAGGDNADARGGNGTGVDSSSDHDGADTPPSISGLESASAGNQHQQQPPGDSCGVRTGGYGLQDEWHITVSNPEKQGGTFDAYVSYQVTTSTTSARFQRPESIVRRRYRDFLWLHNEMTVHCPLKVVPPIPSKDVLKIGDRFAPDFLEYRRGFVENFLRRLAEDAEFCETTAFVAFLEAPSFLGTTKGDVYVQYSRRFELSRTAEIKFKANSSLRDSDIELVNQRTRLERLTHLLSRLDVEHDDFGAREVSFVESIKTFGPCFLMLGEGEEVDMSSAMSDMSGTMSSYASTIMARHANVKRNFVYTIKEYILFVQAALELLNRRDRLHYNTDELQRRLEKLHAQKRQTEIYGASMSLGTILSSKNADELKEERLQAISVDVRELQAEVTEMTTYLSIATQKVHNSLREFEDRKRIDLKRAFEAYAEANITSLQMSVEEWKEMGKNKAIK